MSSPILISLPFSPWSEQARWALEARGIAYTKQRYEPLIGEVGLRRTTGIWRGAVSVPAMLLEDEVLTDSWDIAKWAARHGDGPNLLPDEAAVASWRERGQRGLSAGRALSLARVVEDSDALRELTPKPLRRFGGLSRALTRAGVRRTQRKYGCKGELLAHDATLRSVLNELREALRREGYVLGEFSYADITASQMLAFVKPHAGKFLRLGEANRRVYGDVELAKDYPDLVEWRDTLYAKHRVRRT